MDNQHRKIKGYRELNEAEIQIMNAVKEKAAEVGEMIETLQEQEDLDQRWLSIAKTDLQKGFMAAVRAVTKPGFF